MKPLTYEAVQAAWPAFSRPVGPTGFEYEDPDIANALLKTDVSSLAANLEEFEKYYLMSYLTIEWACYATGAFLIYGIKNWFSPYKTDVPIDDPLAETILYFLTGLRWPIEDIGRQMTADQINSVVGFLALIEANRKRIDVIEKTSHRLTNSFETWKSFPLLKPSN